MFATDLGLLLRVLALDSITAPALVARLYPPPVEPDGWEGLRAGIEGYVGAFGDPPAPESARLALVLRRLAKLGAVEDGPRIVVEGRTAGRARWRVVGLTEPLVLASTPAPTPVSG